MKGEGQHMSTILIAPGDIDQTDQFFFQVTIT